MPGVLRQGLFFPPSSLSFTAGTLCPSETAILTGSKTGLTRKAGPRRNWPSMSQVTRSDTNLENKTMAPPSQPWQDRKYKYRGSPQAERPLRNSAASPTSLLWPRSVSMENSRVPHPMSYVTFLQRQKWWNFAMSCHIEYVHTSSPWCPLKAQHQNMIKLEKNNPAQNCKILN